jgi:hypothetical protein
MQFGVAQEDHGRHGEILIEICANREPGNLGERTESGTMRGRRARDPHKYWVSDRQQESLQNLYAQFDHAPRL